MMSLSRGLESLYQAQFNELWMLPHAETPLQYKLERIFCLDQAVELQAVIRRYHVHGFYQQLSASLRNTAGYWISQDGQARSRGRGNPRNIAKNQLVEAVKANLASHGDGDEVKLKHERAVEIYKLGCHYEAMVEKWGLGALGVFISSDAASIHPGIGVSEKM